MTRLPEHISVMPEETIAGLNIIPDGIYVDGTLGLGGHTEMIAQRLKDGFVVCVDKDESAIVAAKERLKDVAGRCRFVHGSFSQIKKILAEQDIEGINGAVLDLGISSLQLDDPQRGFSFQDDGPLDMRMNPRQGQTAAELLESVSEAELSDIIFRYGEERFARRIARRIVEERAQAKITTTARLRDIITRSMPKGRPWQKIHPATRTFQALRIAVNEELTILEQALKDFISCLKPGGKICVIAFHSLEDRIVKNVFRDSAKAGDLTLDHKKPLRPTDEEASHNPRSRSARLRIAERT